MSRISTRPWLKNFLSGCMLLWCFCMTGMTVLGQTGSRSTTGVRPLSSDPAFRPRSGISQSSDSASLEHAAFMSDRIAGTVTEPSLDSASPPTPEGSLKISKAFRPTHLQDSQQASRLETPNPPSQSKRTPLAPPSNDAGPAEPMQTSPMGSFISVGSSLLLVIGLFFGVAWCYRKTAKDSMNKMLPSEVVRVMGRMTIAPKQQLVLVQFGSKMVLMSLMQGEARAVSEINDPIEVERLEALCIAPARGKFAKAERAHAAEHRFNPSASARDSQNHEHSDRAAFEEPRTSVAIQPSHQPSHDREQLSANELRSYRAILEQGASL